MSPSLHIALLITALVGLPIVYLGLVFHMARIGLEKPPLVSMFFTFGTIGGWMLAFALSPSGLTATCIVFLVTVTPIALFVSSLRQSFASSATLYHKIPIWFGFSYPVVLGICFAIAVYSGPK